MVEDITLYNPTFVPRPFGLTNAGNDCYNNTFMQALFSCSAFVRFVANEYKRRNLDITIEVRESDSEQNALTDRFYRQCAKIIVESCQRSDLLLEGSSNLRFFLQMAQTAQESQARESSSITSRVLTAEERLRLDKQWEVMKSEITSRSQKDMMEPFGYFTNTFNSTLFSIRLSNSRVTQCCSKYFAAAREDTHHYITLYKGWYENQKNFAMLMERIPELKTRYGSLGDLTGKCVFRALSGETDYKHECKVEGKKEGSAYIVSAYREFPPIFAIRFEKVDDMTNQFDHYDIGTFFKENMTFCDGAHDYAYELVFISQHVGTPDFGHWYTYCKRRLGKTPSWFILNDHIVSKYDGFPLEDPSIRKGVTYIWYHLVGKAKVQALGGAGKKERSDRRAIGER